MDSTSNTKKILVILFTIIIIVFAVYFFLFKPAPPPEVSFDEFGIPVQTQVVGEDLISLLEELQSVRFDSGFFRTATFQSLNDYYIDLPSQPQGKSNPFGAIN